MELCITNLHKIEDYCKKLTKSAPRQRLPDIWFVDAHAEGYCRANNFNFIQHPLALNLRVQITREQASDTCQLQPGSLSQNPARHDKLSRPNRICDVCLVDKSCEDIAVDGTHVFLNVSAMSSQSFLEKQYTIPHTFCQFLPLRTQNRSSE
jgi:hypothetical protein